MKYPKIQRAIDTELFRRTLCELPKLPSPEQVAQLSLLVPLVSDHIDLLLEWGGAHLDEIRIAGIEKVRLVGERVVFADDYNGFIFQYDPSGVVFRQDTDGGEIHWVAESIREFIDEVLLGGKCVDIYGEDWLDELRKQNFVQ